MREQLHGLLARSRLKLVVLAPVLIATTSMLIASLSGTAHAEVNCSPDSQYLSGSSWLDGAGVTVCSPDEGSTNVCVPVSGAPAGTCPANSVLSGTAWQCVELVNRLYLTNGWITSHWTGNGDTLIDNLPSGLTDQANGSISYINPGDTITLTYGTGPGHAAIVNSVVTSGGTTTINIINQNVPGTVNSSAYISSGSLAGGNATLAMNAWSGYNIQAIVHAPATPPPVGGIPSSAVFAFNSKENVIARGTDNESYINSWDSSWSGFNTMQSGATFAGNPTGIQYGTEGKVFVRGATTTNEIYESTWNGSAWDNFGSLEAGATFASDPVAIQYDSDTLNLFAIGTDGQMYEISKDPGWGTFGTTIDPGFYFVGNPAVYKFDSNELVFARGTNNEIYQDTYTPGSGWSGFTTMGSGDTFASDPVPFVYDGVLNVFARGTDNQMYDSYYDTSWHAFSSAPNWSGAYFGGDPTVVQYGTEERLYSSAASTNNEIYESTWNGSSWSAFGSLQTGATFSGSPVALYYDGVLSVFARGTDSKLYVISKDPNWGTFGEVQTGAEFNGFSWQ